MAGMMKIPLMTKRPDGLKNARGRNGYFQATTAWIDPILEELDEETGNPIIGLEVWSRQLGDAPPVILRLQIDEWRALLKAIEDAHSEIISGGQDRENYTDEQDREGYIPEEGREP